MRGKIGASRSMLSKVLWLFKPEGDGFNLISFEVDLIPARGEIYPYRWLELRNVDPNFIFLKSLIVIHFLKEN